MRQIGVDTYAIVPEFSPEETKLIDKNKELFV
jgi:hypothetical protein